jgi:hypothetical protein
VKWQIQLNHACTQNLRAMRLMMAVAIGLIEAGPVLASTYTGVIVQMQLSSSSSGGTRVGIQVSAQTSCSSSGGTWYAFEFTGDSGPGKAWLATLLAAKTAGQPVTVGGTGACDQYSVETISYINSM